MLAAVVRLIDETRMRVGNEEYAKDNKSFGATTLRNRHAKVGRGQLKISYAGKHGIKRTVTLTDRNLVRIARKTQDLPGQNLFEYVNDDGETCPVTSSDVNAYIKEAMGEEFTAKDFRTWGASTIAFEEMVRRCRKHGRVKLKSVIEPVAEALGNTAAISRKSYVHPALIEAAKDAGAIGERKLPRASKYLSSAERGLIEFLEALDEQGRKLRQRPPDGGRRDGAISSPKSSALADRGPGLGQRQSGRHPRSRPAIGIAIALAMLAIRSLGCRLIARLGTDPHWPAIFARALAKTKLYFIVLTSAELVAEHASTPPVLLSAIHIGFVIAACLQAAIWARELILGYVAHRTGARPGPEQPRLGDRHHPPAGDGDPVRHRHHPHPRQSRSQRHRPRRRPRHRRNRHRPRRPGHLLRPVRGALDPVRQAVPARRHDQLRPDTGTVERIGLKSTRIRSVGGEEVIVSNANLLNARLQNWTRLERRRALIMLSLVYQTPPDLLAKLPDELEAIVRAPEAGEVRPRPPRQIRRLVARFRARLLRRFAPTSPISWRRGRR